MNRALLRPALLSLFVSVRLLAAEPEKPAAPAKGKEEAAKPAESAPGDKAAIELPKVQVTERRIKQIDNEITKVEKAIAREKKKLKSTDLDKSLNSDQLSKAAAIFGGNSASHMVAVAATRVKMLELERGLLERLKFPRTEEDQALIEKELASVRSARRDLDDAAKQR